jgi:hypothetical protein
MSPSGAGPTLRIRFDIPLCRVGHSPPVRTAIVCTVPPILLLAAVLAAEDVSFVLVGSAALYLYGHVIPVPDIDAVPAPDAGNLARLHAALAVLVRDGRMPSIRSLGAAHVVSVRTSYGRLDCLLGRGRLDWDRLQDGARQVQVSDARVMVASAATVTALRRSHKRTTR